MDYTLDRAQVLSVISDLIKLKHEKIDSAGTVSEAAKSKAEGYIEALYQVENLIINWGNE